MDPGPRVPYFRGMTIGEDFEEAVELTKDPVKLLPWAPKMLKEALAEHYVHDPQLFDMDELSLEKHMKSIGQTLSDRDDALRAKFWYCHDKAAYEEKAMTTIELCAGIAAPSMFYTVYVKNRFKVAWMVCKPVELKIQDLALVSLGKRKMAEYLRMDPRDPVTGKLDYRLMSIQKSIYVNLENRVFGLPTQRVENKNLNINTDISKQEMQRELEGKGARELQNRLQDLKTLAQKELPISLPTLGSSSEEVIVEESKSEPER